MKYIFILIIAAITTPVFAQTEIKIDDAKDHVGETVKICTKIFGGKYLENSNRSPTFLNAGADYPNAVLTFVIWGDVRKDFKNKPEEYYPGKYICVTGKIELYRDKPQIVIASPDQITEPK